MKNAWDKVRNSTHGIGAMVKGAAFDMVMLMYDLIFAWGMFRPTINVKKMNPDAIIPTRGTLFSAGLDLYCMDKVTINPGDIVKIPTGLAFEIPNGFFGLLVTRSSLGMIGVRIAAGANIVDSDYRDEMYAYMCNDGIYPKTFEKGERYAQMVVVPVLMAKVREVDELSKTDRKGGFGSTGR